MLGLSDDVIEYVLLDFLTFREIYHIRSKYPSYYRHRVLRTKPYELFKIGLQHLDTGLLSLVEFSNYNFLYQFYQTAVRLLDSEALIILFKAYKRGYHQLDMFLTDTCLLYPISHCSQREANLFMTPDILEVIPDVCCRIYLSPSLPLQSSREALYSLYLSRGYLPRCIKGQSDVEDIEFIAYFGNGRRI